METPRSASPCPFSELFELSNKPGLRVTGISIIFHFQYEHLQNITLGNHAYEKEGGSYTPLTLCQQYYRNGTVSPGNETFDIDAEVEMGMHPFD